MKRGETVSIALSLLLVAGAFAVVSVRSLPVFPVEEISVEGMKASVSMTRILSSSLHEYYPGLDRRGIRADLSSLPYVDDADLSYSRNTLSAFITPSSGAVFITPDTAYFVSSGEYHQISLEDAGSLYGVYPMLGAESDSEEVRSYLSSVLPYLETVPSSSRLITWAYCVNNNKDGQLSLSIALPELNATVVLTDPAALSRLDESMGIIEKENLARPGITVFSSPSVYELHSDRLVRIKG